MAGPCASNLFADSYGCKNRSSLKVDNSLPHNRISKIHSEALKMPCFSLLEDGRTTYIPHMTIKNTVDNISLMLTPENDAKHPDLLSPLPGKTECMVSAVASLAVHTQAAAVVNNHQPRVAKVKVSNAIPGPFPPK